MARILTDSEIDILLAIPKPFSRKQLRRLKTPQKRAGERVAKLTMRAGRRQFRITARRSPKPEKPLSFSVILSVVSHGKWINLIRHNGYHAEHTNKLEKQSGSGIAVIPKNTFHIHRATERYQIEGREPESYAEPTGEFESFEGAVEYLFSRYGFYLDGDIHRSLYPLLDSIGKST